MNNFLAPFAEGRDPDTIEDLWQTAHTSSYWRNGPVLTSQPNSPRRRIKSYSQEWKILSTAGSAWMAPKGVKSKSARGSTV